MANVKNRTNTPKHDSTKSSTNGKVKKSDIVVGNKNNVETEIMNVDKQHASSEAQDFPIANSKFDIGSLSIHQGTLMTKSGHIKRKSRINLQLMNNILKSELLVRDPNETNKKKAPSTVSLGVNNNIYNEVKEKPKETKDNKYSSDKPYSRPLDKPQKPKNFSKHDDNKLQSRKRKYKGNKLERDHQKPSKVTKKDKKHNNISKKSSKTKQLTLTNGVVFTLSLFQCDHCNKTFSNKSSLRRHIYVHLDVKPFCCSHCSKSFRQRSSLRVHIVRKHESLTGTTESYMCSQCDKSFELKENLDLHLSTHVKSDNSFKCAFCDKKFSHNILLVQHEKQHLNAGRYQCSLCNMNYESRSQLSLHVKSHLNIKDFVCQYCGKEFLRPNSIRRHVEICHGGHRIQCPICFKKLKGHLSEHLRTHENSKPHECLECGQRFTQSTQLNVHRRSHTGARPYPCRICNRPFSHSNALMLHIRRHTGEKPFPCAMCPMSFSQLPHMKAHMSKIHGKNDPYKCQKCKRFFKLKIHLEEHIKSCCVEDEQSTDKDQETPEIDSAMSLSRMRFLLALLLTMIASKEKLKYLGFNKRLIDDLLVESLEAMGQNPCKEESVSPLRRLKTNIQMLLNRTVPKDQMQKFKDENISTEELLEILTGEKKKE